VRQLNPLVPEVLANIVSILLQKRAELRYGDGDAVAADLRLVGSWLMQQRRERAESDAVASVQDCALPAQPSAGSRSAPARDGAQSAS
jgi:serine/threonine-protein kinase